MFHDFMNFISSIHTSQSNLWIKMDELMNKFLKLLNWWLIITSWISSNFIIELNFDNEPRPIKVGTSDLAWFLLSCFGNRKFQISCLWEYINILFLWIEYWSLGSNILVGHAGAQKTLRKVCFGRVSSFSRITKKSQFPLSRASANRHKRSSREFF